MIVYAYLVYLIISVAMCIWVAHTLSKNGLVFLVDSFHGNTALANSINHLLVVGFYLINFGYILLALKTHQNIQTLRACIEFLSQQLGFVLVVLGLLHFFNIFIISKWRQRAIERKAIEGIS